jgi:hypothetical protein
MDVTPPEHLPARPNRRATDGGPGDTPVRSRRRLVRMIASDPEHVAWLAAHNASVLERAAQHLALAGHREAASRLRHIANAHRDGSISPF